jgi:phage shock protein A
MTEPDYTDDGVPTFDYVRDKIENRQLTSEAATELVGDPQNAEEQLEQREQAGLDRLEEIRRSMRGE